MRRWLLIALLLVATVTNAATISAAKAGNWSDTGTWTGGVVPGNGDTADLNNYAVTMDITTIPASGSLLGITDASASGTGHLDVALNTLGNSAINVNYSGATGIVGAKNNTSGLINVTGSTTNTLTITSNVSGGTGIGRALYIASTGPVSITGDILGGSGTVAVAVFMNLNGASLAVNGNITGGSTNSSTGVTINAAGAAGVAPLTVSGNVTGGSALLCYGIQSGVGYGITLSGSVTGGTGAASATYIYGTGVLTLNGVNLVNGSGGLAISGRVPTWTNDGSKYWQMAITEGTVKFGREPAAGKLYTGIVCGDVTGTLTLPSADVVTEGTSFGAGGTEYSGNYHEPLPVEVLSTASFGSNSGVNGTYHAPETSEVVDTATFGAPPAAPGLVHLPEAAEVIDTAKFGVSSGTPGTYHEAETGEVQAGVMFGPASAYTGTYDPTADDVWPLATNVWHDTGAYGPTGADYTPEMVGSDIVNLEAGNIKDGVTIDDVEGTYAGGGGGVGAAFNKGVN